jgi:hypothetical protein
MNIILVKNNVEENGNQPFFFWRKMDSGGKRYLIFGGKWSRPCRLVVAVPVLCISDRYVPCHRGGGRLGEGNYFDQKNNSMFGQLSFVPFGQMKINLPMRSKNLVTDTDDYNVNHY